MCGQNFMFTLLLALLGKEYIAIPLAVVGAAAGNPDAGEATTEGVAEAAAEGIAVGLCGYDGSSHARGG